MKAIKLSLKILRNALAGIMALALLLNIIGVYKKLVLKDDIPLVFGVGYAIILSGSMEPEFAPGDMVIIHKQDAYNVGDIVTFQFSGHQPVTHRIVEEAPDGFITRGDANNANDKEPVTDANVVGRVIKVIPQAGNIIEFFQSTPGLIILLLILSAAFFIPGWTRKKHEEPMGCCGNPRGQEVLNKSAS